MKFNLSFILINLLWLSSCDYSGCGDIKGINVNLILPIAQEKGYLYCSRLKNAVDGDLNSIRKFSTFQFFDAMGYEHGRNLVEMINIIGQEKFIEAIKSTSAKEKKLVESYLSVDLQFGYGKDKNPKTIKEVFPLINEMLNKENQ